MTTTATPSEKPQSHLYRDFPSQTLKPWRKQRDISAGERSSAAGSPAKDGRIPLRRIGDPIIGDDHGSLKELREKLLGHLRETANKMKFEMPSIRPPTPAVVKTDEFSAAGEADRPWNLRPKTVSRRPPAAPLVSPARTMRLRSERSEKKKKKRGFSISLSADEIEEDVFALTGSRPRRRPKKRPRNVQWLLDALFPAVFLPEITPELYKVPEIGVSRRS